jgi:hypothetical protein
VNGAEDFVAKTEIGKFHMGAFFPEMLLQPAARLYIDASRK